MTRPPTRQSLHRRAVAFVRRQCAERGIEAETVTTHSCWSLVTQAGHVAVRVARPHVMKHRVTVGGRSYTYHYNQAHWNCHEHGVPVSADVWVFVLRDRGRWYCYVIPGERLTGSCGVTAQYGRLRNGGHWITQFLDAWTILGRAGVERAA